jgi:hypothetical protein
LSDDRESSPSSSATSSYHEHLSCISIGDTMAIQQIQKYSSNADHQSKRVKKIYKTSPSVSNQQSLDERNEEENK